MELNHSETYLKNILKKVKTIALVRKAQMKIEIVLK